jgi:uncharacterized membrane protein
MKHITRSGAVLAVAALSFAMSGATLMTAQAEDAKVHCVGVNSCKGTSECKTASSSCKGQNACKGQGWVSLTKADCDTQGGKVEG